ncbi:MAG TPA: response regulator [Bryobacteraceae bacterium]|nr:response regulator [Bryobacteraceae bacterium]
MAIPLRLLMVEDSEDDAALLLLELRRGGYEVTHKRVDTAAELISAIDGQKWDLVISDHSMPHFTGIDALHLLRTKGSRIPFIFVSGTIGEETAVSALKDGAQDYLMKTNLKRLVPAVQRELREAEQLRERERLQHQVQQLHKFETIGRLAGGIAHDFNNVIGAILGWAELCSQEVQPGTQLHDRIRRIMDQADRAAGLTSQLLSFARRQFLQPKRIDMNLHVLQSTSLLRRVIGEHITITVETAKDLHVSLADPSQVDQILMNLCLNARDAMPDGGRLLLETRNVTITEEYCQTVTYALPGDYVMLSVSDTGVGMNAETIEQIFEPFFTTKEPGKGTGLGLATVYGIVKQHGGFLNVESEPGKGTTFQIYLPASSGMAETRETQNDQPARKGSETILLAEDHDGLRQSAQEMLQGLGYRVLLAANGLDAVQLFKANSRSIDLVILDVVMPGQSGPDTYSQLISMRPDLKVIFTTGYTTEVASLASLIDHGAGFLQKPYGQRSIGLKVRELLDRAPSSHPKGVTETKCST